MVTAQGGSPHCRNQRTRQGRWQLHRAFARIALDGWGLDAGWDSLTWWPHLPGLVALQLGLPQCLSFGCLQRAQALSLWMAEGLMLV